MHLGDLGQGVGAMFCNEGPAGVLDRLGGAFGQGQVEVQFELFQAANKFVAGEDGGGGDGEISFGAVPLDQFQFAAEGHEGAFDGALVAGELIADGADGRGDEFLFVGEQVLDHAGVAPGEHAVHGAVGGVHAVVGLVAHGHDIVHAARGVADDLGQPGDLGVAGDVFGIADALVLPGGDHAGVDVDPGDAERSEEIALARFVNAQTRGEQVRVEDVLVAEPGLADHVRFEHELDEFLGALALNHQFTGVVVGDIEVLLQAAVTGVRHLAQFEGPVAHDLLERVGLFGGELGGVAGERRHGREERARAHGGRGGSSEIGVW